MCGRFMLVSPSDVIQSYFAAEGELRLLPRYNIAPSQSILVVRQFENHPYEFALLRWGLIPSWIKEENLHSTGWINARIETVSEKPAFKQAVKYRRCLIVADGFYNWQPLKNYKQPYYIHKKDNSPIAMAGIWESWQDKRGHSIESCAILTKQANKALDKIHERMPVIFDKTHFSEWLDPHNHDVPGLLLLTESGKLTEIEAYPVGQQVNIPSHDAIYCIKAIELTK